MSANTGVRSLARPEAIQVSGTHRPGHWGGGGNNRAAELERLLEAHNTIFLRGVGVNGTWGASPRRGHLRKAPGPL